MSACGKCVRVTTPIGNVGCVGSVCDNRGRDVEFVPLTEFLPRVRLVALGVPDDVALEYIGQAAHEFAIKTRLLKRELRFDVQAGVQDYYLAAGANEQVHLVHALAYGKCGNRGCRVECSVPLHRCDNALFAFEPPDKIWLKKLPETDIENGLVVEYVAAPVQMACEVDRLLFERYQDGIVSGALAQLLLMRKYGFADPQLAGVYEQRFGRALTQGKIDVAREFKTGSRNMQTWGTV